MQVTYKTSSQIILPHTVDSRTDYFSWDISKPGAFWNFQIRDFPAKVTTMSMTPEMGIRWRYPKGRSPKIFLGDSSSVVLISNENDVKEISR